MFLSYSPEGHIYNILNSKFKYGGKRNGSKNQIEKNGTEEGSFL
jgi:hypothetical protein